LSTEDVGKYLEEAKKEVADEKNYAEIAEEKRVADEKVPALMHGASTERDPVKKQTMLDEAAELAGPEHFGPLTDLARLNKDAESLFKLQKVKLPDREEPVLVKVSGNVAVGGGQIYHLQSGHLLQMLTGKNAPLMAAAQMWSRIIPDANTIEEMLANI
jgi:hypothetical protein